MEVSLEHQEIQEIANLSESLGYKLLLDKLKAEIDTIQMEMMEVGTPVNSEMLLFWRALYRLYEIFKTTPVEMQKEIANLKTNIDYNNTQEQLSIVPPEYLKQLLEVYQKKKNVK